MIINPLLYNNLFILLFYFISMTSKFILKGFYNYVNAPRGRGDLNGEIEVEEDGSFEGKIYDHASIAPEQILKGRLKTERGLNNLLFLKFPNKSRLSNLVYSLNKPATDSFEGEYFGQWGALPFKIMFNKECNLFITAVDLNMYNIGDSAKINLYKK